MADSRSRLPVTFAVLAGLAGWLLGAPGAPAATDPGLAQQWGLAKIGAPSAWSAGTGSGITIAVVDTGVDLDHDDLVAKIDTAHAHDWVDGDATADDAEGHGTHVAGIAAATTNNGKGVAGTAPGARILPLRVLDEEGDGNADDVVAAIDHAVAHGAQVVNLSLGELSPLRFVLGSSIEDAVNRAWAAGVVCVVAAGNEFLFPSGYGGVNAIVVSASTKSDSKSDFSNSVGGARWGMAAPGGGDTIGSETDDILSTYKDNKYAYARGTSMAAPFVSGAAAVLRGLGLSPQETVERLLTTATDIGPAGPDSTFGAGRLDLAAAVEGLGGGGGGAGGGGSPTTVSGSGGGGRVAPAAPPPTRAPSSATTARPRGAVATQRPTVPTDAPTALDEPLVADLEEPIVVEEEALPSGPARPDDDAPDPLAVALGLAGVAAVGGGAAWLQHRRRSPAAR